MSNGEEMIQDMDFEARLEAMGDDQLALLKFVARQQYATSQICPKHSQRLKNLEDRDKKTFGVAGSIGGGIALVIGTTFILILKKFGIDI
jgi:hypothetical protein